MDIPTLNLRWGEAQSVAIGATSATTNLFGRDTWVVLNPTGNCWFTIGTSPTATKNGTAGSCFLPGGSFLKTLVPQGYKVAVIQDASVTGFLNVVPSAVTNTL